MPTRTRYSYKIPLIYSKLQFLMVFHNVIKPYKGMNYGTYKVGLLDMLFCNLVGTMYVQHTIMKFISTKLKNKRGTLYNTRATKVANGWSKHVGGSLNHKFSRLSVVGTFDSLGRVMRFDIIRVRLKHPTDFGYVKESYILKKNKAKFEHLIV